MIQLWNLVNRGNVRQDISGQFNAAVDFEFVTRRHIIVAALCFFGMADLDSVPSHNTLPVNIKQWSRERQWNFFSSLIGQMVDQYVIVHDYITIPRASGQSSCVPLENTSAFEENPHSKRIAHEHTYCSTPVCTDSRRLPRCLQQHSAAPYVPQVVQLAQPDGVYSYACSVLCDGLLLLELRDAIHQGDGPRILCCWKFMLLYFKAYNHNKYALEAFWLLAFTNGAATSLVKQQITWARTVNHKGGCGKNIPVDLFNEHLNRTLKDTLHGLGANITEERIVSVSRAVQCLSSICHKADTELGIPPTSLHHTTQSSEKDEKLIIEELLRKSHVFDYVPGRTHYSFSHVHPCIVKTMVNKGNSSKQK